MDSNDFEKATRRFHISDYEYSNAELPECTSMTVSGIHGAVIEGDIDKAKRCIESGESVNKKENQHGYSPLHLAVMCMPDEVDDDNFSYLRSCVPYSNVKMLEFLLAEKGVEVDSRCSKGETPLYLATALEDIDTIEKLIEAGSDINASDDENDRPLHMSVCNPRICKLLLQHGAVIYTDDKWRNTMHIAIRSECLEVVHMLLYYNVDANNLDKLGWTPFMTALSCGNKEAQEILLEYENDFNRESYDPTYYGLTLSLALEDNSPFIKDVIERGADVNYGDDPRISEDDCAFSICLHRYVSVSVFKMVWERLRFNDAKNTIDLLRFLDYVDEVPVYLPVIIESDNFEVALQFFSKEDKYFLFINKYAEKELDLDQLTILTCRLLQYGFRTTSYDISAVFSHYGYCELFRILLYMDNDLTRGWLPDMALPRLILEIDFNLETLIYYIEDVPKILIQLLEYSVCPRLIEALSLRYSEDKRMRAVLSSLRRVPSLIELARNAARRQIWQSFKVANTCQFYTTIEHFDMPTLYKDILTFKRKMYVIDQSSAPFNGMCSTV